MKIKKNPLECNWRKNENFVSFLDYFHLKNPLHFVKPLYWISIDQPTPVL